MIIDAHCHAGTGTGLSGPWDTSAPLGVHLRRAAAAGIDRVIVFGLFHDDYEAANAEVARLVAARPDRLIGWAAVHAQNDQGRVRSLVETAVRRYGFRGLKVHRLQKAITREVCDAAREFGLPVIYDVAGAVAQVELLVEQYPDVNFILPHLGSFADDWRAHIAAIDQIVRHANVYADTSGVRRFDYLVQAVRRAGAHKLIFGSDGPWLHPGLELHKIKLLNLPPRDARLVLGENILRLMRARRAAPGRAAPVPA